MNIDRALHLQGEVDRALPVALQAVSRLPALRGSYGRERTKEFGQAGCPRCLLRPGQLNHLDACSSIPPEGAHPRLLSTVSPVLPILSPTPERRDERCGGFLDQR